MLVSSLVALNNLSAPAATICGNASCTVTTRANALQAECLAFDLPQSAQESDYTLCSSFGNTTCRSKTNIGRNFTTGPVTRCEHADHRMDCLISDFAVIFGLWTSHNLETGMYIAHAVDCKIHRGSIEIRQNGTGTPILTQGSFTKSTTPMEIPSNEYYWQQMYSTNTKSTVNPYRFSIKDPIGDNNALSEYLLGNTITDEAEAEDPYTLQLGTNDTQRVARAIEANMDMSTLFAFARSPHAASLNITTTLENNI